MKYLLLACGILLLAVACNNKNTGKKNVAEEQLAPYYKVNDLVLWNYNGKVQQINDTIYDHVEKQNGQWTSNDLKNYELHIHKYDSAGYEYVEEAYMISEDAKVNYHKATWIYSRKADTTITYGLLHDFASGKTDTLMISYNKPTGAFQYVNTVMMLDNKAKQYTLKETRNNYLDSDYERVKTIFSYPNDTLNDTITYTKISDRTDENNVHNKMVVLAKDAIGNPSMILDRQDPERKQLHRIGYIYYK